MNREILERRLSILCVLWLGCALGAVACQSRDEGDYGAGADEPGIEQPRQAETIGQPGDGMMMEPQNQPTGQSQMGRTATGEAQMGQQMGQSGGLEHMGHMGQGEQGQMAAAVGIRVDPNLVSLCQIVEDTDPAAASSFTPGDEGQLTDQARQKLDTLAQCLTGEQLAGRGIEVAIGAQPQQDQAQKVADYLQARGVKVDRVGTPATQTGTGAPIPAQSQGIQIRLVS